jgi:Cu/Ag efflux protein CusF
MRRVVTILAAGVAFALTVAQPYAAVACKGAGAFKHVGVVTAVDSVTLTVTIKDAETGDPVTFSATAAQLQSVKPGDDVMIGFVEKDGKLTAVNIRPS